MATKANPQDQTIQPRDINAFNQAFLSMEKKQYSKAIQNVDTILPRYPTNGELTALKGMCQAVLAPRGDDAARDAGIKLMKQGLMWNLKSHRSWTIQAHYYRNDKQYAECLKSYTQVQKLLAAAGEQTTVEFLRDLTTVQAQARRWDEYIDTRRQLIIQAPNHPQLHWPGFAVGCHLGGRLDVAIEALNLYQNLHRTAQLGEGAGNKKTIEESEICLYRVEILYQKGDFEAAYDSLISNKENIIDLIAYALYEVRLLIKLNKFEEAKAIILDNLLAQNCDQLESIILFFKASEITLDNVNINDVDVYNKVRDVFNVLLAKFPKSASIIKLSLQYFNQGDISSPLIAYIQPSLSKGVPSLFKTLKSLYTSNSTAKYIETTLLSYLDSLKSNNTFPNDTKQQTPTTLLSTYVYLAQHYDYYGKFDQALELLDQAEKHTPTFIDLYIYRAKVYKHTGNHQLAYYWIDFARNLDFADRWLNNKCSVYAYQAGHDDEGERTISTFIKESRGTHIYQYHEQASWWFYQAGLCYMNNKKHFSMGLKYLSSIDDFFTQYQESVYDYHQYCVRKAVLRAYTGMLNYLTAVKTHKFYLKAILPLINSLITMQYQVNFEKALVSNGDFDAQVDYNTVAKKDAITAQNTKVEEYYGSRPAYVWRKEYLTKLAKKNKKDDRDDLEAPGQMTQNPEFDILGQDYLQNTFIKKITQNDYNVFVNEAQRYINIILEHNKGAANHAVQSNVSNDIQNTQYLELPPSLLLLSIQSLVLTQHPLRALQQLQQANELIKLFDTKINNYTDNIISPVTADQTLKTHFNGVFPWFQIKSSTPQIKLKLLSSYYSAQLFISKMLISKLCLDETKATSNMNKVESVINAYKKQYQKAIDNGMLYNDLSAALTQQLASVSTLSTPCKKIITLSSILLASYYTQTKIDINSVIELFQNIVGSIPNDFEFMPILRAPLQSILYVCDILTGNQFVSQVDNTIPILTGLVEEIKPQQCTFLNNDEISIVEKLSVAVKTFGAKNFVNSSAFMSKEQIDEINTKYSVTGPDFVTPPEKDEF